jgi:hypothetical protein
MSIHIDTIYIGGEWVTPSSTSKIAIQSLATGEPVGSDCRASRTSSRFSQPDKTFPATGQA